MKYEKLLNCTFKNIASTLEIELSSHLLSELFSKFVFYLANETDYSISLTEEHLKHININCFNFDFEDLQLFIEDYEKIFILMCKERSLMSSAIITSNENEQTDGLEEEPVISLESCAEFFIRQYPEIVNNLEIKEIVKLFFRKFDLNRDAEIDFFEFLVGYNYFGLNCNDILHSLYDYGCSVIFSHCDIEVFNNFGDFEFTMEGPLNRETLNALSHLIVFFDSPKKLILRKFIINSDVAQSTALMLLHESNLIELEFIECNVEESGWKIISEAQITSKKSSIEKITFSSCFIPSSILLTFSLFQNLSIEINSIAETNMMLEHTQGPHPFVLIPRIMPNYEVTDIDSLKMKVSTTQKKLYKPTTKVNQKLVEEKNHIDEMMLCSWYIIDFLRSNLNEMIGLHHNINKHLPLTRDEYRDWLLSMIPLVFSEWDELMIELVVEYPFVLLSVDSLTEIDLFELPFLTQQIHPFDFVKIKFVCDFCLKNMPTNELGIRCIENVQSKNQFWKLWNSAKKDVIKPIDVLLRANEVGIIFLDLNTENWRNNLKSWHSVRKLRKLLTGEENDIHWNRLFDSMLTNNEINVNFMVGDMFVPIFELVYYLECFDILSFSDTNLVKGAIHWIGFLAKYSTLKEMRFTKENFMDYTGDLALLLKKSTVTCIFRQLVCNDAECRELMDVAEVYSSPALPNSLHNNGEGFNSDIFEDIDPPPIPYDEDESGCCFIL
eukprot:TRINITY_DN52_c0_g1_i1.p1 TRINITY_DN52_c0_g1~~TRINITY_DN52_c0_g1_i1.p1  ORF type:complete len:735 (-),score=216.12 TRINITY_DN52_c0_g1_i1:144-2309(-)